jgi:hypothetical protein
MTEGRQPFTAEIKTLAKRPSTYDPFHSGRPRHSGLPLRLHRIQLAERSDRHERPARRFVIYADSAPPHKSCLGATAGVHRTAMSALIVIFVFVIFQFLAASRRAFQAP